MPDLAAIAMLVVGLILAHGTNARIARLMAEDEITKPVRTWINKRFGYQHLIAQWIRCPWCAGWWTAWPIAAVAWFPIMGLSYWWLFLLAGWSVAHAAGRLNHNHAPVGGR